MINLITGEILLDQAQSEFRIACVKNRFAKHSAMGDRWIALKVDASRMKLSDEGLIDKAKRYNGVMSGQTQL